MNLNLFIKHFNSIYFISTLAIWSLVIFSCSTKTTNKVVTLNNRWGEVFTDTIPMTEASVLLGEKLFFDKNLSSNKQVSCASCHHPEKAFTDGRKFSIGAHGNQTMRNSPTLLNIGFHPYFMLDGGVKTLEMQLLVPLLDSNEMDNNLKLLIPALASNKTYDSLARVAFDRPFDVFALTRSLAHFQRTLLSQNSKFDNWYFDNETDAITNEAIKGWKIFDELLNCTSCHQLPAFTDYSFQRSPIAVPTNDPGRFRISRDSNDLHKFKVPTLRNITLTAPYFHAGQIENLDSLLIRYLDFYNIKEINIQLEKLQKLKAFFETLED